jgi:hypothetical protein
MPGNRIVPSFYKRWQSLLSRMRRSKNGSQCASPARSCRLHHAVPQTSWLVSGFAIWFLSVVNSLQTLNTLLWWLCSLFSESYSALSSGGFGNLSNLHTSQKNTNLLQHICRAYWTICILVTKEIMRLLTINLNLITQNTTKDFLTLKNCCQQSWTWISNILSFYDFSVLVFYVHCTLCRRLTVCTLNIVILLLLLLLLLLLKCLSALVQLLEGFNNIAFARDLTSRPVFTTDIQSFIRLHGP